MFERMKKLASLADQALVSGGNFLTIAICAHALPLSEQGKFTYVFASYMALLLLNVAGIFQGAAIRAPGQGNSYQPTLAKLQIIQAALFSLAVCAAWFGVGDFFGWQATLAETVLLYAFLTTQQLADFDRRSAYIFSGTRRAVYSSAALYPIRIIALLIIQPETVSQVLCVMIISALLPAVATLIKATNIKGTTHITPLWLSSVKQHLVYSRLYIAGTPLIWLWANIPIFLLGTMFGKEQVAILASIRGISNVANVFMEQIETKVVAEWARVQHKEGSHVMMAAAKRLLLLGVAFWLVGMVVISAFGREIVSLALGNLYAPHWHVLMIGWVGYGVFFLARMSAITQRTLGSNTVEFIGNLSGVCAALVVGYLLIPQYDIAGAAWVYVGIAAVMLVSQMMVSKTGKGKSNA